MTTFTSKKTPRVLTKRPKSTFVYFTQILLLLYISNHPSKTVDVGRGKKTLSCPEKKSMESDTSGTKR